MKLTVQLVVWPLMLKRSFVIICSNSPSIQYHTQGNLILCGTRLSLMRHRSLSNNVFHEIRTPTVSKHARLERLWRCPNISISTKIKQFNTTCVTVLLYGCESWVLSKAMESEINAFGTSCYRIMLNIKRIDRVSNAKIYDLTQTAPLVENVRTRQLRFLGHLLRMPDDEPCKEYALYIPPHGKRKPGRQRTLFLRYIQYLLADTDNMIGPGKLSEVAQDRCGWRKLVVACSTADR